MSRYAPSCPEMPRVTRNAQNEATDHRENSPVRCDGAQPGATPRDPAQPNDSMRKTQPPAPSGAPPAGEPGPPRPGPPGPGTGRLPCFTNTTEPSQTRQNLPKPDRI